MASIYDKASLVLIPSGTKTSKVYSQKPVNGDGDFTFSRSTAATRVNADGNIEKETQNLILQSNQFDTTWSLYEASLTSGHSGYDGTNNAWKLIASTNTTYHEVKQNLSQSGVQNFSVYAKADGYNYVLLYANGLGGGQFFNLSNGTKASTLGSAIIDSNIENIGSGWYRCSITFNATNAGVVIQTSATGSGNVHTGDGTSGVLIQDAQLEQGLVARDYIETTTAAVEGGITDNVPRLDYTDSSCPALLLEPQRTNAINISEYFGSNGQGGGGGFVITDNYTESPEGYNNAARIQYTTGNTYMVANSINMSTGEVVTMSIYAKGTAGEQFRLYCDGSSGASINTEFTLTADWARYETTSSAATANGVLTPHILVGYGSSNPADDFQVYGWQGEKGSYATSYIPTYGTSVTRNQDSFDDNGYQANNIFGADSGSIFFDFGDDFTIFDGVSNSSPTDLFQFVDITSYGGGYMRFRGGESNHYLQLVSMGAADNSLSFNDQTKYCICWDSNGVDFYGDGALIQSTTISIVPSFDRLERGITGNGREGRIKEVLFFPTKLSSQDAIALTTI